MKRVFAHIGFSFAITLLVLNFLEIEAAFAILTIAGAVFLLSILFKRTRESVSLPLCAVCAFVAAAIFISNYYFVFLPQTRLDNKIVNAEFYIVDLAEEKYDKYYYTVQTSSIENDNCPQNIRISLKSDEKINAEYYQKINGKLRLRLVAENGFSSYGSFGNSIFLSGTLMNSSVDDDSVFSINKYILNLRQHIKDFVSENISTPENGIIMGILIGDKSEISSEISENFKYSGVSHIMAVSGLHLAVFCGFVSFLLKKIRIPEYMQVVISVLCTVFYMALAGFSKSIIRAGIMMIIMLAAKLFKERGDTLNSLGFAVFVICLNPYAVTDVGALLTVSAVLGLCVIHPALRIKGLQRHVHGLYVYIYNVFSASVSVFLSTLPVVCLFFGYVSVWGILLNIIMIPLAQIVLISSFLFLAVSWCSPLLFILSKICEFLASIIIFITEKTADIPYAVIDISDNKCLLAIGAVLIIFGIAIFFNNRRVIQCSAALSIAAVIAITAVSEVVSRDYIYIKEINGYYTTTVVAYDKKNAVVIGVNDSLQYSSVANMLKSKNLDVSMIIDMNDSYTK